MSNGFPYSALYIDMTYASLFKLIPEFLKPSDRRIFLQLLTGIFTRLPNEKLLTTLSVRTCFDLYFQVMNFPLGSEIVLTSINIPDMVKVIRYHGLIPIPASVDADSLAPTPEAVEKVITPRTKAIMISFVWGAEFNADYIYDIAKKHNLPVLEDCAESFSDSRKNGNPRALISFFSFGTIKINTAYGGALNVIRDEDLYKKMNDIHEKYPIQTNLWFLKKIFKNMIPMIGLNTKFINIHGRRLLDILHIEYKERFISMLRGFPGNDDFLQKFRKQPPTALLAMLALKMSTFDAEGFKTLSGHMVDIQQTFMQNGIPVPGNKLNDRVFWCYPILVPDVHLALKMLNDRGVDAYLGATQLKIVESPVGYSYHYPHETAAFFDQVIYLPIHKLVPPNEMKNICRETISVLNEMNAILKAKQVSRSRL